MLLLLLPPLLQTHRTAVLMSTTGYFAGQSTAVVEILQSSAPGQQAAPLISQRLTLFFCGAAVRVKKVEQTALACQQPQLLPTALPIFILSSTGTWYMFLANHMACGVSFYLIVGDSGTVLAPNFVF